MNLFGLSRAGRGELGEPTLAFHKHPRADSPGAGPMHKWWAGLAGATCLHRCLDSGVLQQSTLQRFLQVNRAFTGGGFKEAMKLHPRGMLCERYNFHSQSSHLGNSFGRRDLLLSTPDLPGVTARLSACREIEKCPQADPALPAVSCSWDRLGLTVLRSSHLEGLLHRCLLRDIM